MRWFIKICCLVLAFSFFICACSKSSLKRDLYTAEDTSLANIVVKGRLVIGVENICEPFTFLDSKGQPTGFDVDVFLEIAQRLEVEPVFVDIDWSKKYELLQNGKIDCIASAMSRTKEIQEQYAVTSPYLNNVQVVVVRKNDCYKTLSDLKGKILATRKGSTGETAILNSKELKDESSKPIYKELKLYTDFSTSLDDLQLRYVDAVVNDLHLIKSSINKNNSNFCLLDEALLSEYYVYAFRKEDILLRNTVEEILNEMEYEGITEKISRKWFGSDICIIGK